MHPRARAFRRGRARRFPRWEPLPAVMERAAAVSGRSSRAQAPGRLRTSDASARDSVQATCTLPKTAENVAKRPKRVSASGLESAKISAKIRVRRLQPRARDARSFTRDLGDFVGAVWLWPGFRSRRRNTRRE